MRLYRPGHRGLGEGADAPGAGERNFVTIVVVVATLCALAGCGQSGPGSAPLDAEIDGHVFSGDYYAEAATGGLYGIHQEPGGAFKLTLPPGQYHIGNAQPPCPVSASNSLTLAPGQRVTGLTLPMFGELCGRGLVR
jgi:Prokaryotic lipoprotein-attachment site